jgi:Rrf2 family protein
MSKLVTLSEAASIGIHSMVLIARTEETINVNKIAEITFASRHHVAKVLQRLVKEKLLSSNRGPGGGFALNKPANKITLLQIYECIEGVIEITNCPVENQTCPFGKCLLGNVLNKITKDLRDFLNLQTLDKYL